MKLIDSPNTEPGCYVEGSRGWTAVAHFLAQFAELTDDENAVVDRFLVDDDEDAHEIVTDMADELVRLLNDALPDDRVGFWAGGEFFIMPYCGDDPDCTEDECGCRDW